MVTIGMPEINMAHVLGIGLFLKSCVGFRIDDDDKTEEEKDKKAMYQVLFPPVLWLEAWIVHMFI